MRVKTHSIVGLDLGCQGDYSALALLNYLPAQRPTFEVPCLRRWALGTSYRKVGQDVARFLGTPDLQGADREEPELVIDVTGVGLPVAELVIEELARARVAAQVIQVTITAGNAVANMGRGRWHVSKRILVSELSAVVHGGRLRVAQDTPEAAALLREMSTFRAKISLATGNESFEAWRERDHDDLTLAVALACFWPHRPRQRVQGYCEAIDLW